MIQNEWTNCSLDDLLIHVIGGDWGQDNDFSDDEYETVSCIRGSEFRNWRKVQGATAVPRKIKKSSLETRNLRPGDVLIEISGGGPDQPVGRTVLITEQVLKQLPYPAVCTNFLRLARPAKHISSSYLNYFLTKFHLSGEVIKYQGGSNNLRNLKFKEFSTITVPCPSFAEQKEIADRLDKLLAQVEATQARLARIPDIIKQFRQSVLAAAVSGKLTKEWRTPCQTQSINEELTAPSIWKKCSIGEIVNYVTSGSRGWAKYYSTEGELFIRSQDISSDRLIIEDAAFVILPTKAEGTRTKVKHFDLLITITGANVTKCALVDIDLDNAYVSQHVALIRLSDISNAKFLDLVLKAPNAGRKQLTTMAYGGGKPGLNLQNIKDVTFALPSKDEQTEIVRRVEQLFAYADSIEQQAKAARERVDNLTQAILAKAFRGELTADWRAANPDLISGDNSAAALLARIQAERQVKAKRSRRGA
ncbi:restriction endonuclease subunit S [Pseudaeromonas sp. ZJS20]|uniref:restriction endonuclease subunit S n=1 Tax=Pseudaeromonas aegiceratis TaxID=3153928 RepID=UPI00390C8AF2